MQIKVNGEIQEFDANLTVSELLVKHNVERPEMVSVQLNGEFVNSDHYSDTALSNNDEVDFLYFMGGGA